METARSTGIILDSVYTAKAARGMVEEINKNPARFKGNKILFIHTGIDCNSFKTVSSSTRFQDNDPLSTVLYGPLFNDITTCANYFMNLHELKIE